MSKDKEKKTFFEVFSMDAGGKGGTQGTTGGEGELGHAIPKGEDIVVISDMATGVPKDKKRSWRGPFGVRLETIILASVGGVLLAVGCFFLGHKLGSNKAPKEEVAKAAALPKVSAPAKVEKKSVAKAQEKTSTEAKVKAQEKNFAEVKAKAPEKTSVEVKAKPVQQPVVPEESKWSLRVISYKDAEKNLEKATSLAKMLKSSMGHDAFVARLGSQIVVCLGEFNSKNSTQLLELQKQLKDFEYENKKQFAGCYPVRIR